MARFYSAYNSSANSYSVFDSTRKNEFKERYCVEPMLCRDCAERVVEHLNKLAPDKVDTEMQNPTYGPVC